MQLPHNSGSRNSLFLLGLLALGCRPPPSTPLAARAKGGSIAFVDVSVVPMDSDRVVPHQTVIVRGQRIAAVGPSSEVEVPPGAKVIDGRGRYVMPGLADMHIHLDNKADLLLLVANGVTTARNMWGWPHHLKWRTQTASGELLGPTIVTAGPIIDGYPPARPATTAVKTPQEARRAAEQQKRAGYDFIKFYSRLTPATFDALAAAAKKLGMPMAGHVPHGLQVSHVLDRIGGGSIEHLEGYVTALQDDRSPYRETGRRRTLKAALFVDPAKIAPLARRTIASRVWAVPTLVVTTKVVPKIEREALIGREEMKYVPPLTVASWDLSRDRRWKTMTAENYKALRQAERIKGMIIKTIVDQGGRVLAGTDASNPFVIPGYSLHEELALLVAAGLTPFQAIRSATADAADFLDMKGEFGVVRAGARADLVLVSENPLVHVSNAAKRAGVMVRGRWLSAGELHRRLTTLAASYHKKRDPFSGMPSLVCSGKPLYRGRYEILWRGKNVGAERLVVCRPSDGATMVSAQATDDYDKAVYTLTITHRGRARQSLRIHSQRPEGRGRLELTVTKERLRLRRHLPPEDPEERDQEQAGAALLVGESVETCALLKDRLASLSVGQVLKIPARQVGLRAGLRVNSVLLVITRRADAASEQSGDKMRMYRLERVADRKLMSTQLLALDAEGWPVSLESKSRFTITFRRVSRQPP